MAITAAPSGRRTPISFYVHASRRCSVSGVLVAVPLLVTSVAFAAPKAVADASTSAASGTTASSSTSASPTADAKKKAMEHFETGLKLYEDGDFGLALIEFERAYSYVPDYRVLYNIGQVSVQLGRYARAAMALADYLKAGGPNIPAARIASVREDLKMLEGRTAHLQITCNVDGAEILLDDVRLAHSPIEDALLVDAGEHRLTLQKPGYITRSERIVLAGRDETKMHFDLAEVPKATAAPAHPLVVAHPQPKTDARDLHKPMSTRTQLLYAGAGATGLLTVAWAVTGYVGIKAAGDLHDALQRPTTPGEVDPLRSKARGALIASDILGAAALVTGATTLYFTLKGPSKEQPKPGAARVGVHFAPSSVQLSGTFRPEVGVPPCSNSIPAKSLAADERSGGPLADACRPRDLTCRQLRWASRPRFRVSRRLAETRRPFLDNESFVESD